MIEELSLKINTWNAYGCLENMAEQTKCLASVDETSYSDTVKLSKIYENMMEMIKLIEYMRGQQASIAKILLEEEKQAKVPKEGMDAHIL